MDRLERVRRNLGPALDGAAGPHHGDRDDDDDNDGQGPAVQPLDWDTYDPARSPAMARARQPRPPRPRLPSS